MTSVIVNGSPSGSYKWRSKSYENEFKTPITRYGISNTRAGGKFVETIHEGPLISNPGLQTPHTPTPEQVAQSSTEQTKHKLPSVLGTSPPLVQTTQTFGVPSPQLEQFTGLQVSHTDPSTLGLSPPAVHVAQMLSVEHVAHPTGVQVTQAVASLLGASPPMSQTEHVV